MGVDRPTLWVVATPIGNLGDMSPRAVDVLRQCAVIAAEDTRQVRKLLSHFDIPTPTLLSYREENRVAAAEDVLAHLAAGREVALVTDAGTPAISDPGEYLVARCHDEGIVVSPLPGPSAVLCALVCSGLPTRRFTFEGFLSRRASHRREHLESLRQETRTMVFLEAPSRVEETLAALVEVFGPQRRGCLGRELTKKFEEIRRSTLGELLTWSRQAPVRGEITLVVEGFLGAALPPTEVPSEAALRDEIEAGMRRGLNRRQAAREVAARYHLATRDLYNL